MNTVQRVQGRQNLFGTTLALGGGLGSDLSPTGTITRDDLRCSIGVPLPTNCYLPGNLKDIRLAAPGAIVVGWGVTSPFGLTIRSPATDPDSSPANIAQLPFLNIKLSIDLNFPNQATIGSDVDIYTFACFLREGRFEKNFISR